MKPHIKVSFGQSSLALAAEPMRRVEAQNYGVLIGVERYLQHRGMAYQTELLSDPCPSHLEKADLIRQIDAEFSCMDSGSYFDPMAFIHTFIAAEEDNAQEDILRLHVTPKRMRLVARPPIVFGYAEKIVGGHAAVVSLHDAYWGRNMERVEAAAMVRGYITLSEIIEPLNCDNNGCIYSVTPTDLKKAEALAKLVKEEGDIPQCSAEHRPREINTTKSSRRASESPCT